LYHTFACFVRRRFLCLVSLLTLLLVAPLCNLNSASELLRFCNAADQLHACIIAQGQASTLQRRSRLSPAAARRLPSPPPPPQLLGLLVQQPYILVMNGAASLDNRSLAAAQQESRGCK
jgi:hypothetical protein